MIDPGSIIYRRSGCTGRMGFHHLMISHDRDEPVSLQKADCPVGFSSPVGQVSDAEHPVIRIRFLLLEYHYSSGPPVCADTDIMYALCSCCR